MHTEVEEVNVPLKTIMAAPQQVGVDAATASVLLEVRSISLRSKKSLFQWKSCFHSSPYRLW